MRASSDGKDCSPGGERRGAPIHDVRAAMWHVTTAWLFGAAWMYLTMGAALRWGSPPLGFAGVSALGAVAHAGVQLWLAGVGLVGTSAVWSLAPLMGTLAGVTGFCVGIVAGWFTSVVEKELARE